MLHLHKEDNAINQHSDIDIPLVVDLDGTLIKSDLLYEGIIALLKKNPFYIFKCMLWLLKGKAILKNEIFKIVSLNYELLPVNKELLAFLQAESIKGRRLVLATASPKNCAEGIGKIYPLFLYIYGTTEVNLKGRNKLDVLTNEFGESKFDYIGNATSDLKIFAHSRYSYLVDPSKSLERKTRKVSELKYSWKSGRSQLKDYINAIRAYQWVKNILIFVPLITSHSFYSFNLFGNALGGFFAFSFVASAGYVINDLLDLTSDRSHPRKKFRPFASGKLSILSGVILAFVLLASGVFISLALSPLFLLILVGYFLLSLSYSLYFKRIVLYDVFFLSLLYSTRIIAGGIVISVSISFWLIAFSTFIFLSLAFVKRYAELMKISDGPGLRDRGREYTKADLNLLQVMGIVSGFLSVIVFSLYINSPEVSQLYANPKILWGTGLLFLFWISRMWIITNRGEMTDDPIVFAIKDLSSYVIFFFIGLLIWIAI